ncbi:3-isopropylmalate dehydratase small subunit [Synergistales bacterium]|nr:3-isopropylmalate dehydratase small subunit [Synergistales bacterium]
MADKIFRGNAHVFGDNINTDLISPAQYMEMSNEAIAAHAMEGADPDFVKKMKWGDILVAGENFGSGSSRETAPIALKGCGVSVIIAKFFARIFYRNCINIGLPVLICEQAKEIGDGNDLEVDLEAGTIHDLTCNHTYQCAPLPANIVALIQNGGLLGDLDIRLKRNKLPADVE